MKRRWLLIILGVIAALGMCVLVAGLVVESFFDSIPCASETAILDMDSVLQYALSDKVFNEPKDSTPYRMWMDLHQWLSDAHGQYELVLLGLDIPVSPGDDATVGARLSTGVNIICNFYNDMVESCYKVEQLPSPETQVVEDMQSVLIAVRENPAGSQLKLPWLLGISKSAQSNLQQWISSTSGDIQVDQPVPADRSCMFMEYTVKVHSAGRASIICRFLDRYIESCEPIKE
jgi:hypothetical protein